MKQVKETDFRIQCGSQKGFTKLVVGEDIGDAALVFQLTQNGVKPPIKKIGTYLNRRGKLMNY